MRPSLALAGLLLLSTPAESQAAGVALRWDACYGEGRTTALRVAVPWLKIVTAIVFAQPPGNVVLFGPLNLTDSNLVLWQGVLSSVPTRNGT